MRLLGSGINHHQGQTMTLFINCEACQTEGRILTNDGGPDDVDHGVCPECNGECVVEVETEPVTLEDWECEDCIGMKDQGCYCQSVGAVSPSGPTRSQSSVNKCQSCGRMFVDGETCSRGGCPMGGDF